MTLQIVYDAQCGYSHLDPLPDAAQVNALYRDRYYQEDRAQENAKASREWWYWRQVYQRRYKTCRGLGSRVLDVGAGFGHFLEAVGGGAAVEPSPVARRTLQDKGIDAYADILDVFHSADWIHCCMVLEHVRDPFRLLCDMRERLTWKGTLCVVVPNEFNPLQDQLAARFGYSPVHRLHVNYFSIQTITNLMRGAGFDVFYKQATFPMEWFALHGLNYVRHPWMGRIAHEIRMRLEAAMLHWGTWDRWAEKWAAQDIGREVVLYARKRIR